MPKKHPVAFNSQEFLLWTHMDLRIKGFPWKNLHSSHWNARPHESRSVKRLVQLGPPWIFAKYPPKPWDNRTLWYWLQFHCWKWVVLISHQQRPLLDSFSLVSQISCCFDHEITKILFAKLTLKSFNEQILRELGIGYLGSYGTWKTCWVYPLILVSRENSS